MKLIGVPDGYVQIYKFIYEFAELPDSYIFNAWGTENKLLCHIAVYKTKICCGNDEMYRIVYKRDGCNGQDVIYPASAFKDGLRKLLERISR